MSGSRARSDRCRGESARAPARQGAHLLGRADILVERNGVDDSGQSTNSARRGNGLARHVRGSRWKIAAASTLPLLRLIDVALDQADADRLARCVSSSASRTRRLPQIAVIATNAEGDRQRREPVLPTTARRAVVPASGPATRTNASAALTLATSADTPYTPNTLASCAIGSTVAWL